MFQISHILQRIRLFFCKERESYFDLYPVLGFYPRKIRYYKEALLHKSLTVRGAKGQLHNNERLEFLGDAILDAVVADIVYRHFEKKSEGFLTNTRSKIVQRETLNRLAVEIGLDKLIKASSHSSNTHNNYMYGNAFEALVGAIYLDRGYACCKRFIEDRILHRLINIDKVAYKEMNFKSKLIEWTQKNKVAIEFRTTWNEHFVASPEFETEVLLEGLSAGSGIGYSKKESQQVAAKQALGRLKKDTLFLDQVYALKYQRVDKEEQDEAQAHHADYTQEEPINVYTDVPETRIVHTANTDDEEERSRTDQDAERIIAEAEEQAFREANQADQT